MGIGDYPPHWEGDLPEGFELLRRERRIENCHVPNMASVANKPIGRGANSPAHR